MHRFKINNNSDGVRSGRYFLHLQLPEHPLCYLLGHRPTVHRLPLSHARPGEADEYRWVECTRCLRRSDRQVPPAPQPVNYDGIAASTERRSGWSGRQLELSAELYLRKPARSMLGNNPSARLHIGGRGSETPYDAHLDLGVIAGYFSIGGGFGTRLAERLTGGKGRDIKAYLHGWHLYWKLWTTEDHNCPGWRDGRYQPWRCRDGNITVNLCDYLYGGSAKYSYEDVEGPTETEVALAEGSYPVTLKLQRQTLGRPRGPRTSSWCVDWSAPGGIPFRNHDWKGDCVYNSAVKVDGPIGWVAAAKEAIRADVLRDRERYDWRDRSAA